MAHLDKISRDLLEKVASEIAEFINRRPSKMREPYSSEAATDYDSIGDQRAPTENGSIAQGDAEGLVISESLTVWKLKAQAFEAIVKPPVRGDVFEWVEEKPFSLHHQIRFRGKPSGFARSYTEAKAEEKLVFQISSSEFAANLNDALELIEQSRDPFVLADPVVRLLEVPPFHTYALWMFLSGPKESRLEIIASPERYRLAPGKIIDSKQF